MEQTLEAMRVALRVLTAVNERQDPAAIDVEKLKAWSPGIANGPLDELACDVVQRALRLRLERRARAAG